MGKIMNTPGVKPVWHLVVRLFPRLACKLFYRSCMGVKLNMNSPQDLNEKIQWLKVNANKKEWARLADKYAVREYVRGRGLEDILVPLYGKWNSSSELMADWDTLPRKFVLKTTNGCGTVYVVTDKEKEDKIKVCEMVHKWLAIRGFGIHTVELHYSLIRPCIIAEALLEDPTVHEFSRSLIDYKLWCFDGMPYTWFVAYDREIGTDHHIFDNYDLEWKRHPEHMTDKSEKHVLPKPEHYNEMIEVGRILSKGHHQVRVDMYNIAGKIYFGELTLTAQGGYMDYFTKEFLLEMGNQIDLTTS